MVERRSLETKKLDVSSSDVGETRDGASVSRVNDEVAALLTVNDEEVDGVGGVAGHTSASLVDHLLDVTVISGDDANTLLSKDDGDDTSELVVDDLEGLLAAVDVASVADHIRVGVVDTDPLVLLGLEGSDELVGDLLGLHLGVRLSELVGERGDFLVELELVVDVTAAVAVPEEGNVTELVGLGKSVASDARGSDELGGHTLDVRRRHEEGARNVPLGIVLHETGVVDLGALNAIEGLELVALIEGLADLHGTITTEVPVDHTIAVDHLANGLAVLADDDEGRIELVELLGIDLAGALDGLAGALEVARILVVDVLRSNNTADVSIPTALDDAPVALVSVHGDVHTATTRGDESVNAALTDSLELLLEHVDVLEARVRSDITTVEKDVHTDLLDAGGDSTVDHLEDLLDVGVHITVGKKTEHVDCLVVACSRADDLVPVLGAEESTALKALLNELGALAVDLTAAKSVVTDLTVTHIRVRGKTHSRTVSLDQAVKIVGLGLLKELVVVGHGNLRNWVSGSGLGNTKTIDNNQNNRALTRLETF